MCQLPRILLCLAPVLLAVAARGAEDVSAAAGHDDVQHLQRCGAYALKACFESNGMSVTLSEILAQIPPDALGASLLELQRAAGELSAATLPVAWKRGEIPSGGVPGVLPVVDRRQHGHFVALLRVAGNRLQIPDFPRAPYWTTEEALRSHAAWRGEILYVARRHDELAALRARTWQPPVNGLAGLAAGGCAALCAMILAQLVTARRHREPVSRNRRNGPPRRSGFTVIELLVAMAIMSVALALALPAIQRVRERARAAECLDHLRQLMLAASSFHASQGRFPPSEIPLTGADGRLRERNFSLFARLLPHLDQRQLFDSLDASEDGAGADREPPASLKNPAAMEVDVALYRCPSDGASRGSNYRGCTGTGPALHETLPDDSGRARALGGAVRPFGSRDAEFRDGLSNTVFFSERVAGDFDTARYDPWRDVWMPRHSNFRWPDDAAEGCRLAASAAPRHFSFAGATWLLSGPDFTWYNHALPPNAATPDCSVGRSSNGAGSLSGAFAARSHHAGGVNVVMADGAARFVNQQVSLQVWRAISTVAGGESAGLD